MFRKNKFRRKLITHGIIIYVITAVISTFVGFFVSEIFREPPKGLGIPGAEPQKVYVIFCIVSGIAAAVVAWLCELFLNTKRSTDVDYLASDMGPAWENRIKKKKPMTIHTARLIVLSVLFIGILSVVYLILYSQYLKKIDLMGFNIWEKSEYLRPSIIVSVAVPIAPVCAVHFHSMWEYIRYGYCPKCGAVFPFTNAQYLGTEKSSGTRQKSVTREERVGEITDGIGRIDVYSDVTRDYTQDYSSSSSVYGCHCGFCGAPAKLSRLDSYHQSDWKEK